MGEPERGEEIHQAYPATVLSFEGGPRLPLRDRLTPDDRRALAALELGPSFAVLTAEEPGGAAGELTPDEAYQRQRENVRRTLRLEEHLAREGIPFRRVDATAPDGSRRQRLVAVALSRGDAEQLARERDQLPVLWYDGERFRPWRAG